jgi:hypothetical protein
MRHKRQEAEKLRKRTGEGENEASTVIFTEFMVRVNSRDLNSSSSNKGQNKGLEVCI